MNMMGNIIVIYADELEYATVNTYPILNKLRVKNQY